MKYPEGTPEHGLQRLAVKYGGAAAVFVVNDTIVQYIMIAIMYIVAAVMPGGSTLLDTKTDAGFLFTLLINEITSYAVPLIALYAVFYRELKFEKTVIEPPELKYKRYFGETVLLYLGGSFAAACAGIATNYVSFFLNSLLGIPETKTAFSGMMPQNLFCFVCFLVIISIVGPVCEEIIFRHILLRPLRRYGDMTAAIITAFMFGLTHFNFDQFLYTFAFGFFLAVVALRAGSVIPAILCHVINNAVAVLTVYLPDSVGVPELDSFLHALANTINILDDILMFVGIPVLILIVLTRLLVMKNRSGIPVSKQIAVVLSDPLLLVSVILTLVITFVYLYRSE